MNCLDFSFIDSCSGQPWPYLHNFFWFNKQKPDAFCLLFDLIGFSVSLEFFFLFHHFSLCLSLSLHYLCPLRVSHSVFIRIRSTFKWFLSLSLSRNCNCCIPLSTIFSISKIFFCYSIPLFHFSDAVKLLSIFICMIGIGSCVL